MPDSSRRSLTAPIWRALQVALAAIFGSAVLFFGLTRTEVGRANIRSQVENSFNQRFEGSLSIGKLSGTLISDVVATDVQLRGTSGDPIVAVDSVVAEPHWLNLLTSELSVQTLTLIRPHIKLHRDSSRHWNLPQALHRPDPSSQSESPLDLTFADVRIRNGRVTSTRTGTAPEAVQNDWLFDYTRTEAHNLSVDAYAQRLGTEGLIEIQEASFGLGAPADLQVSTLRGQIRREDQGWGLESLALSLDTTRIRAEASVESAADTTEQPSFDLRIRQSRLDHDELRRLVPRFPLEEAVSLNGHVEGTPGQLTFNALKISHNSSSATLEGTISDLSSSTRFDLSLLESRVELSDARAVWPSLPSLPDSTIGPLRGTASVQATTADLSSPSPFTMQGQVALRSAQGAVRGSLAVRRNGSPTQYQGSLKTDSLNLAPLTGRSHLASRLTGRVEFQGARGGENGRRGTLDVALSPGRLANRRFVSANGRIVLEGKSARGQLVLQQRRGGTLRAEGRTAVLEDRPNYSASISVSNFDISSQEEALPSTRLNARLTLQAAGTAWHSLTGTADLTIDSSRVYRGDSTAVLPPHTATLQLNDRTSDRPRAQLTSSVASVRLDGTSLGPPLWRAGRAWGTELVRAARRELGKPAPLWLASSVGSLLPALSSVPSPLAPQDRPLEPRTELSDSIEVRGHVRIHRSDILRTWWPSAPTTSEDVEARGTVTLGPDRLQASGRLSASRLRHRAGNVDVLALQYDVEARSGAPLAETMTADLTLSARQLEVGGPSLRGLSASLAYGRRSGTVQVRADSLGIVSSLQVDGDVRVTPSTNELRVRTASMEIHGQKWSNPSPASINMYSDAVRVASLSLERSHPQAPQLQQFRIAGTTLPNTVVPLSLTAEHVYLPPFSRALRTPKIIGGNLNGEIQLTGERAQPKLDASASVQRLSYDRHVLADVRLQTQYSVSSPDLRLDLALDSVAKTAADLTGPDFVPEGARFVEPSDLTLSGRIRLPEWAHSAPDQRVSRVPEGETLDLDAKIDRADLFFFEYIFEDRVTNVQGFMEGSLHIGGEVRDPVFDADLRIQNGAADLPRFGLEYEVSGPVGVDRQGIHLRDIAVRGDEGSATVVGDILFNRYEYFSFDLSATLDGITVMDVPRAETLPFYGHIRASGPVSLTGPLSDATLRSNAARTTPDSELSIPVSRETVEDAPGFIVFADSTGQIPNFQQVTRRENILADRPEGQPTFVEGMNIDLNVIAPEGSTVNLVFDPVVGDIVTAVGSGRVQLQRKEGSLQVYGNFNATSGTYLFTAGEVFVRRFSIRQGTITWDGDPINAKLDLNAEYRTRASPSGLPNAQRYRGRIPVTVQLDITERVATPQVDLSLALDRDERNDLVGSETLDAILNQPTYQTEYATSVLLTNTFLLTTGSLSRRGSQQTSYSENRLTAAGNQLAFNSVSQLVSSQLNRYLGAAFPNVDLNFGVQGEDPEDLDLIYGVALRLLNERLVIRGEGIFTGDDPEAQQAQGPRGEFTVEVRLSRTVSANLFYRRKGDDLTQSRTLTSSRGVGVSFQTEFSTWTNFFVGVFGWLLPIDTSPDEDEEPVAQEPSAPADSTQTAERP